MRSTLVAVSTNRQVPSSAAGLVDAAGSIEVEVGEGLPGGKVREPEPPPGAARRSR